MRHQRSGIALSLFRYTIVHVAENVFKVYILELQSVTWTWTNVYTGVGVLGDLSILEDPLSISLGMWFV